MSGPAAPIAWASRGLFLLLILLPVAVQRGAQAIADNLQTAFAEGEAALKQGDLARAERAFHQVLTLHPGDVGAFANLGVIYMRRGEWQQALAMLERAEQSAPGIPGIRLNIALVYYRQNDFRAAITPLESVVRDQADSLQARYLLGLCYFFRERYAEAAETLEGIWPQESSALNYLYALGIAAEKAGRTELRDRAFARLVEIGQDSPEFHLLMGKAFLNDLQVQKAIEELNRAASGDPKLPFVHYNLGLAYRKLGDYKRAKEEFIKDVEIEPDVAYNYDELGAVCHFLQQEDEAEHYFREAIRRDPTLPTCHFGLAKIFLQKGRYAEALAALDTAGRLDSKSASVHYLRGRVLQAWGHGEDAQSEFAIAASMQKSARDELEREVSGERLPNPEIAAEPRR